MYNTVSAHNVRSGDIGKIPAISVPPYTRSAAGAAGEVYVCISTRQHGQVSVTEVRGKGTAAHQMVTENRQQGTDRNLVDIGEAECAQ